MERLEGKTDDIHESVPFVRWLQDVGVAVSHRLTWLGVSEAPRLQIATDSPLVCTTGPDHSPTACPLQQECEQEDLKEESKSISTL